MTDARRARTARVLERTLFGLGALALSHWAWEAGALRIHQRTQGRRLESLAVSAAAAAPGGAARREAGRSGLVGRIEMPRLGLVAIVEEGVDQSVLRRAVGHVPGTAFPGEAGNVVVAAHRDSFFRALEDARPGDALRFTTPDGEFRYEVADLAVVPPSRVDVLEPRDGHEATLITCYPFAYVGPAPWRLVVRARLSEPRAARRSPRWPGLALAMNPSSTEEEP